MQRRQVVTAFLEHQGEILLLKRSDKVRTYPEHWAGVSGSIEEGESPEERVLAEIKEETGLDPFLVTFRRRGRPLPIRDEDTHWVVHPFLYHVDAPDRIRLDWEHTEKRWISPEDINDYPTVPNLPETWRRVAIPEEIAGRMEAIQDDRSHGASELADWALDALGDALGTGQGPTHGMAHLRDMGWHLSQARPSMAPLMNALAQVLSEVRDALPEMEDGSALASSLADAIERYRARQKAARHRIVRDVRGLLSEGMTVFTHSYSSTVVESLLEADVEGLRVLITESRPLNEGVETAKRLTERHRVTLITDAQAAHFMDRVDRVLIGADSVLADGSVVNKVGSALIAQEAQQHGMPVYVVSQTSKFYLPSLWGEVPLLEEMDAQEVLADEIPNLTVRNIYFEVTPADRITRIVTEKGWLRPGELRPMFERRRHLMEAWGS